MSDSTYAVPAAAENGSAKSGVRRFIGLGITVVVLVVGGCFLRQHLVRAAAVVTTDDATVQTSIHPVLPQVSGYVAEVVVRDNQAVHKGDVLMRLNPQDLQAKLEMSRASLAAAEAGVTAARAAAAAARAARVRAESDVRRLRGLADKGDISGQQWDAASTGADAARAQEEAAQRQVQVAEAQVTQRAADVRYSEIQLSYTTIVAATDGIVSRKNVEVGQFVPAGQPLCTIVENASPWVVANYKETQMHRIAVGRAVEIDVDAYPGHVVHGKVESIAAGTGAAFALLPPDNATGNFTKVTQRVPVKIVITDAPDPARPLRVGMSVTTHIAAH